MASKHSAADGNAGGQELVDFVDRCLARGPLDFDSDDEAYIKSFFALHNLSSVENNYKIALRNALGSPVYRLSHLLLEANTLPNFLEPDGDIISLAISAYKQRPLDNRYTVIEKDLLKLVTLLVRQGAPINAVDIDGNTPLYHACVAGYPKTFLFLAEEGAYCNTLHDAIPDGNVDSPSDAQPSSLGRLAAKVNLLHIAFAANLASDKGRRDMFKMWETSIGSQWGPIVSKLLQAGQTFDGNHPAAIRFLHTACHQGQVDLVSQLLQRGINIDAPGGRSDKRNFLFGSALHVATLAGQKAVTELLLAHGADAKGERKSLHHAQWRTGTPLAFAFTSHYLRRDFPTRHLACFEVLVQAGVPKEDGQRVLASSVGAGNVEMAQRLLGRGLGGSLCLSELPHENPLDMILLLAVEGEKIDFAKVQAEAAKKGDVDIFKALVELGGRKFDRDLYDIAIGIIKSNHWDMLRCLIKDCGVDVNATFTSRSWEMTNLLCCTLPEQRKADAVRILLENGADMQCPDLPMDFMQYIQKGLKVYPSRLSDFSRRFYPVIRLIEEHQPWVAQNWSLKEPCDPKAACWPKRHRHGQEIIEQLSDGISQQQVSCSEPSRPESPGSVAWSFGDNQSEMSEVTTIEPQIELLDESGRPFSYHPLDGVDLFRLLELEPCESSIQPIRCRVVHAKLSEKPQYETLTYYWTEPSLETPQLVSRNTFEVSTMLWTALRRVRKSDTVRRLWINPLCVNHSDLGEKGQQVRIMVDIWHNALGGLVWIGEAADDSHLLFKHHADFKKFQEDYNAGRIRVYDPFGRLHLQPRHYAGATLAAYEKLSYRPVYFQFWSVQEMLYAGSPHEEASWEPNPNTLIMCGTDELPWETLCGPGSHTGDDGYHPLDGPNRFNHQWRPDRMNCSTSDPRDKVFGWVTPGEGRPFIPADYSLSTAEAYWSFTRACIEWPGARGGLSPLQGVLETASRLAGLPSWVPDYAAAARPPVAKLPQLTASHSTWDQDRGCFLRFERGGEVTEEGEKGIRDWNHLVIRGRAVATVCRAGDVLPASESYRPGTADFSRVLLGWEALALEIIGAKQFPRSVSDAFADTLVGHDGGGADTGGVGISIEYFPEWYDKYVASASVLPPASSSSSSSHTTNWLLQRAEPDFWAELEDMQAWITGLERRRSDDEILLQRYARNVEMACYGRRFVLSSSSSSSSSSRGGGLSMGLAPARSGPGDKLVLLPDLWHARLVVLRPRGGDGTYEMLGDAMLYGLDVRELLEGIQDDPEEFVIV
ncbi:hypothetical protein BX600DRAFT_543725 [Xylariales sp. PMI_506]|nr:hypothetical protein BX600DRAFT_543725 [Xylariales sp. PMI_506]